MKKRVCKTCLVEKDLETSFARLIGGERVRYSYECITCEKNEVFRCTSCRTIKKTRDFHKNISLRTGHHYSCKECRRKERRLYRKRYANELKKKRKERRERSPEKYKARTRAYRKRNREKIKTYRKHKIEHLTDEYIRDLWRKSGILAKNVTSDMLLFRREHVKMYRLLKKFKEAKNGIANHRNQ